MLSRLIGSWRDARSGAEIICKNMKLCKAPLCWIPLLLLLPTSTEAGVIASVTGIAKAGIPLVRFFKRLFTELYNGELITYKIFERPGMDKQIISDLSNVISDLQEIQASANLMEKNLISLMRSLPHLLRLESTITNIHTNLDTINRLFDRFAFYEKNRDTIQNYTLLNFAKKVVSHDRDSAVTAIKNLHYLINPSEPLNVEIGEEKFGRRRKRYSLKREGVLDILQRVTDSYGKCLQIQSPQQAVYDLLAVFYSAYTRGYTMVIFSYNILQYHDDQGDFMTEKRFADRLYLLCTEALFEKTKTMLNAVSNEYLRCDPRRHVEGETYVRVTNLFQGYVVNEASLHPWGLCCKNCAYYKEAWVRKNAPKRGNSWTKGKVFDCRYIEARARICKSEDPSRLYDWVSYKYKKLGREGYCKHEESYRSWNLLFKHCSYCMCLYDDPMDSTTDRFISLRKVVSDVEHGKVVTGIRFVKKNRIIQAQIQEGKALPEGRVDAGSLQWVQLDNMRVDNSLPVEETRSHYFTLDLKEEIDLDSVQAPEDHVVTGLRFKEQNQRLTFEIRITKINFGNGTLLPETSQWMENTSLKALNNDREKLDLKDSDDPRKSPSNYDISAPGTYVTLTPSSLVKDVSQLTVPFFDAQSVAPSPATWLEGLALYHRGRKGYGGFIGFKVFSFKVGKYLELKGELAEEDKVNENLVK